MSGTVRGWKPTNPQWKKYQHPGYQKLRAHTHTHTYIYILHETQIDYSVYLCYRLHWTSVCNIYLDSIVFINVCEPSMYLENIGLQNCTLIIYKDFPSWFHDFMCG